MPLFTQSRIIDTAQGPLTVTAVYNSDTFQVVFTVTTASGITATYTDSNQLNGINGADRFALVNQLESQGVNLTPAERRSLNLAVFTAGSDATKLFRDSVAPAESAGQEAQAAAPQGPNATPPKVVYTDGQVATPPATTTPTNANVPATTNAGDGDSGTNAPVRTLEQTQAVDASGNNVGLLLRDETGRVGALRRNPETGELYDAGSLPPTTLPGVGATEENPASTRTETQAAVNADNQVNSGIKPQPNVLDRFASYAYQAAVYLLTPQQLNVFQLSEKKSVNGYNLLFQSGGAPINTGGPQGALSPATQTLFENDGTASTTTATPTTGQPDAGRNPYFAYDYYIDSVKITNAALGKATGAAHSVTDLKFTVVEPANITLIDNIYKAVQDLSPKSASGAVNYAAACYLMVLRFYGYDANGNLQQVGAANPNTGLSDANALVEKFIPFRIKNINWAVNNKLVIYDFDCAPIGQLIAGGTKRGTIPADIEITGATVSAMLKGQAVYGSVSAPGPVNPAASTLSDQDRSAREAEGFVEPPPPKATAAPTNRKTIQQGLIEAMNAEQQRLKNEGVYTVADQYELVFANGAQNIQDAIVQKPTNPINKAATPISAPVSRDPSAVDPAKGAVNVNARNFGLAAGTQLLQAIELIIRNSSYVTNQANVKINEVTGVPEATNGNATGNFRWFNILMQATPLGYDEKRNDFAYRIRYIIVPFQPAEMKSNYFPDVKFPGLVKRYSYWFTGENTQVLSYQANFNKLYIQTVTGSSPSTSGLATLRAKYATSMREIPFLSYQSRSTESSVGADGKTNEIAANAAEYLYNPADNGSAKIKIIGDPAWIQQGSVSGALNPNQISYGAFSPDGTINFDTQDVLFEIAWQRPEDYNLNTGVADPYSRTEKQTGNRQPLQSIVYRLKSVTSLFNQGRFEQDLEGIIYMVPTPQQTNSAVTAVPDNSAESGIAPGQNARDDRLARGTGGRPVPSSSGAIGGGNGGGVFRGLGTPTLQPPVDGQSFGGRAEAARLSLQAGPRLSPQPPDPSPEQTDFGAGVLLTPPALQTPSILPPPQPPTSNGGAVTQPEPSPEVSDLGAGTDLATARVRVQGVGLFIYAGEGADPVDFVPEKPQVGQRDD